RNNERLEQDISVGAAVTVNDIVNKYSEDKMANKSLNYRKSAARFLKGIRASIGRMPVKMITPSVIVDKAALDGVPLRKLWVEKHPTAVHLHSHLKRIFSMAKARCGLATNPAAWADNLQHLLPDHKHKVKSRDSLHHRDLPKFMADLRRYED